MASLGLEGQRDIASFRSREIQDIARGLIDSEETTNLDEAKLVKGNPGR
jgi:hypothetical protein